MTGIDYEALAKAWYFEETDAARLNSSYWDDEWDDAGRAEREDVIEAVKRVVAALADQGYAVVRTEGVAMLDGIATRPVDPRETASDILDDVRRVRAALAPASPDVPPEAHRPCPAVKDTDNQSEDS